MKVYVTFSSDWSGPLLDCVFSSFEKAKQGIEEINKTSVMGVNSIAEILVDGTWLKVWSLMNDGSWREES